MPQYRNQTFRNAGDIDRFFSQFNSSGYVDWYNKNAAGQAGWTDHSGKPLRISNKNNINWQNIWNNISIIYGKDTINLVEFLCLNSIITNETGGLFQPVSERVGSESNGAPGIAYAFNKISGLKLSYNTLNTNKKAYDLFRDSIFINAHGTKPLNEKLKNTVDTRWAGETFPQGFSGLGVDKEVDKVGKSNTFLFQADFMKFRGRGYIQTTGRSGYLPIIDYILKYNGQDATISSYKTKWQSIGSSDRIATISTSEDWDTIFQNSNSIIPNYAVYLHASKGGAKGIQFYHRINSNQSDANLQKAIKNVAYCVAGGGADTYADKFLGRVIFILNRLESQQAGPVTSEPGSLTTPPETGGVEPSQTEGQDSVNGAGGSQPYTDGGQGSVSRQEIVNVFESTIKPSEIRFKLPSDRNLQDEFVKTIGLVPFVWYNAFQISPAYLKYFELGSNSNNLPQIKLIFQDEFGFLKDKAFPLDDTKITIFISPRSEQLKPIHLDFKIAKFNILDGICTLTGILDVSELMLKKYVSLGKKTSFNALQELAKTSGLGFSTNISDTADEMLWMQNGKRTIDFIEDISKHGYISDQTFVYQYIDFHYNLTYVDVEKEVRRDITNELGVANTGIEGIAKLPKTELVGKPVLTNDQSLVNSPGYFQSYRILNNSTNISISQGYSSTMKIYDDVTKKFIIFNIDGLTENPDSSIIMKGSPQDETFFNANKNLIYSGKLDDNVHLNYQFAETLNSRNLSELSKVGIEITLESPNYNFYRFKKVKILISNQAPTPTQDILNNRLSGFWIIVDIRYIFNDQKYTQVIRLVKRELELSPEEASKEPPQQSQSEQNVPIQNNPAPGSTASGITASGTSSVAPTALNQNPTPPPNFYGTQSAPPADPPGADNFPLTKEIFKKIYQKYSVPDVILERYYKPLRNKMIEYKMESKERIATFIVMINQQSSYLKNVTEDTDGKKYQTYEGNTSPEDGFKFRPRGLIKMTPGKRSYDTTGKFLKKDFITDPNVVAADNQTHLRGSMTDEQIENSILVALKLWTDPYVSAWSRSSYGDLRILSDNVKIISPLTYGTFKTEDLPNQTTSLFSTSDIERLNLYVTKDNNFATANAPLDQKALSFLQIHFAINDSYESFRDNVIAWNEIRELLK